MVSTSGGDGEKFHVESRSGRSTTDGATRWGMPSPPYPTATLRDRYKGLLLSEWDKGTTASVVGLLWQEVRDTARPKVMPLLRRLDPSKGEDVVRGLDGRVVERIGEFRRFFPSDVIPPMPEAYGPNDPSPMATLAEAATTYLPLQSLTAIDGETGFFLDAQSLLFLASLDELLPRLRSRKYATPRSCPLNAVYMHALTCWRHDPAHQFYLTGALMGHLRDPSETDFLREPAHCTPVADHSYLTKVQAYVFALMDSGQEESAFSFLLAVYRASPPEHLDEVREMMDQVRQTSTAA